MYASPPLSPVKFYILLALSRDDLHGYALTGRIWNESRYSLEIKPGQLYPLLKKMTALGLIEPAGLTSAGKHGKPRMHYRITNSGLVYLKTDLRRLQHALAISEAAGHFDNTLYLS